MRGLPASFADLVSDITGKAARLQHGALPQEANANIIKTALREKAVDLLTGWIDRLPDGRYILIVGGGNGVRCNSEAVWVSKLPGHFVSLPGHRSRIKAVGASGVEEIVLAGRDTSAAIVAESVGGYLADEPSPQEIVFELSSWRLND